MHIVASPTRKERKRKENDAMHASRNYLGSLAWPNTLDLCFSIIHARIRLTRGRLERSIFARQPSQTSLTSFYRFWGLLLFFLPFFSFFSSSTWFLPLIFLFLFLFHSSALAHRVPPFLFQRPSAPPGPPCETPSLSLALPFLSPTPPHPCWGFCVATSLVAPRCIAIVPSSTSDCHVRSKF